MAQGPAVPPQRLLHELDQRGLQEMNGTEIIPYSETVSLPITVEQAQAQWDEYQRLTQLLLNETDYQKIGSKQFKKKSAWRKYARAFNITDHVTFEHIERSEDGFPLWARIRVEASHPNGRSVEADHECHVKERCCAAASGMLCEKKTWRGHTCCLTNCNGRNHWSHPGDLPATALTRAKNRAISDLIGAGEVSAEEMEGQRSGDDELQPARRPARATANTQNARQATPRAPTQATAPLDSATDLTNPTRSAVAAAYQDVQAARGPEFLPMVRAGLMAKWPKAFTPEANRIGQLTEAEALDVLAYLEKETPD